MINTLIVFALHRLEQQTHTQKQDQQNERLMKNLPISLGTIALELLRLFSEAKRAPENSTVLITTSSETGTTRALKCKTLGGIHMQPTAAMHMHIH